MKYNEDFQIETSGVQAQIKGHQAEGKKNLHGAQIEDEGKVCEPDYKGWVENGIGT